LTLPADYDPTVPHRVVLGYAGTNWVGEQIRPYLDLENQGSTVPTIYVYPDPLWREFQGWGTLGGWALGPYAAPADGEGDLSFTSQILDHLEQTHCVDTEQVFVTGHSWGGDMAHVAACFLGDRITGALPVAANTPYWFDDAGQTVSCTGDAAVWTLFGQDDDYFTNQSYPGEIGDAGRDFWLEARGCDGADAFESLPYGVNDECVEYTGCDSVVRYCLYEASAGHQVPSYYGAATMDWFDSFQSE
jgi:polyhydroxybutyrate depolymerase